MGNGSRQTDVTEIERVLFSSARPISVTSNACGMPVMYHWLPYVGSSVGLLLAKSRFHVSTILVLGALYRIVSPWGKTMRRSNKEKTTGSKGFEPSMVQGLARCGGRGGAGAASPSSSDCNRCERRGGAGVFTSLVGDCNKIATWNVRSLYVSGKLANVLSEMKRMKIDIMGVAETCWDGEGSFPAELPESEGGDKYKVFFSGGKREGEEWV